MRCGLAHCPGAKSTRFPIITIVSFSHDHAISSRPQRNTADLPSGRWVPTAITIPWIWKKTINMALNFEHTFLCLPKISCAIQTRVHETCSLHRKPQSIIEKFSVTRNLMLTPCSLLQSDIFRPRIRTRLYLKMRPLVLSKAIELSLVTLWQVKTCSIAVCLSLPSHSWFPSYRISLVFFVSDHVHYAWWLC